jgi:membrane fusion protein, copper/silver efflux system
MKRNYFVKILPVLLMMLAATYACKERMAPKSTGKEVTVDSSIALLSKPVNSAIVSAVSAISAERGMRIVSVQVNGAVTYDTRRKATISSRVSGRIEKLYVKYNFQAVRNGQLIMEVYSPDLAAAQRELLLTARSGDYGLMFKARQRLQLLGMQNEQIDRVITSGNIVYRVPVYSNATGYILEQNNANVTTSPLMASAQATSAPGGMNGMVSAASTPSSVQQTTTLATPVLLREGQYVSAGQSVFTIYKANNLIAEFALQPGIAARVKKGQKILFSQASDKENTRIGTIGLIEPVVQGGQSFPAARVYIGTADLKPGQLLTGHIPVIFNEGFWVPKQAVLQLGSRSIVFKKEGGTYSPVDVKVGTSLSDRTQVLSDISDWQIASNAYYLVDSESFIRTKQVEN